MSRRISNKATLSIVGLTLFSAFAVTVGACGHDKGGFEESQAGFDAASPLGEVDAAACPFQCSLDGRSIIRSCSGEVIETCDANKACGAAKCQEPCAAAAADQSSNGCEFYFQTPATRDLYSDSCYAAFVVNTSTQPMDFTLDLEGKALDVSKAVFRTNPGDATLISHTGPLGPGESVVVFVSDHDPAVPISRQNPIACPKGVVPAMLRAGALNGSGIGSSFHLKTTMPVSLVAMYPFGGAASYFPTATLVLPVVTWAKQHVVVGSWEAVVPGDPNTQIVAAEDDTQVTILPTKAIQNGPTIKGGAPKVPAKFTLGAGKFLQLSQFDDLTGSIITSNKPTTVFSGHGCADVPSSAGACDVLWQQVPAYEQWGSEYASVGYRPRIGDERETMPYRIVAARDGTRLDYDPAIPVGAPTVLNAGEVATFPAGVGEAFVVRTQDVDHPIYVGALMTGFSGGYYGSPNQAGWGDPEFVNVVPAGQYLNAYSFYADPSYDQTSLVVVRAKSHGEFKDVWLECAGALTDFKPMGTRGDYEWTRVDLIKDHGPGQTFGDKTCQSGLQNMKSDGPFTATIWGWGFAASYAYPGGMAHRKLVTQPLPDIY
ncbi:hypothetical protein AKJ09_07101 [Labilithrix luteola]|uniref:IgGFc-binding protein N-terminal domain-containing protein n=1 Tax=Labilithrix luteola TaxID=1391654 RepID=A0A0K1Q3W2_9BACT|nr:IgGFc-binding protein [Labilithrix luteola]AKV00438.1 hypothetical protein AKJ09_07101 [Labilithrix luteola]